MGPIVEDLTPPVDLGRDHWRGGERAMVDAQGDGPRT